MHIDGPLPINIVVPAPIVNPSPSWSFPTLSGSRPKTGKPVKCIIILKAHACQINFPSKRTSVRNIIKLLWFNQNENFPILTESNLDKTGPSLMYDDGWPLHCWHYSLWTKEWLTSTKLSPLDAGVDNLLYNKVLCYSILTTVV